MSSQWAHHIFVIVELMLSLGSLGVVIECQNQALVILSKAGINIKLNPTCS